LLQPQEIALRESLDPVRRGVKKFEGVIAKKFWDWTIQGLSCSEAARSLVNTG